MPNKVVHFEIETRDPDALGKFYQQLFGWNVQSIPDSAYTIIDTVGGRGINGGIGKAEDEHSVKFYVAVPDINVALEKIESLGGRTLVGLTETPMVTFALFQDPDGNVNGLVLDRGQEPPGVSAGSNPPVAWFEVLGKDAIKLQSFYADAFGWTIRPGDVDGISYGQVEASDAGIGGGISASQDGQNVVMIYAEVDELQKYLDRAAELGAKTLVEPLSVDKTTSIAIFADPQGNSFGMFSATKS